MTARAGESTMDARVSWMQAARARPAATCFCLLAVALISCYAAVPDQRPLWWGLLGVASVAAVAYGIRTYRPSPPAAWILLCAALAAEAIGDLVYLAAEGRVGGRAAFPTVADGFFLAVYPLAVLGLLLFARRDPPAYRLGTLLDVMIIATGLAALTWTVFVVPYSELAGMDAWSRTVLIGYLVGDAVLLALAFRLPLAGRLRSPSVLLLFIGVLGLLVSDTYYGLAQLHPDWSPVLAADLGWAAFYVCWGLAALLPSMARVADPPTGTSWALASPRTWIIVLWCAALVGPALLLVDSSNASRLDNQLLAAYCTALFALVFARLAKAMSAWQDSVDRRNNEAYFRTLVADASDAIVIASPSGSLRYASPAAVELFGARLDAKRLVGLFDERDQALVALSLESIVSGDGQRIDWPITVHVQAADGRRVHAQARWSDLREDPTVAGIVLTLRDVTEERRLQDELRLQALTDPLTGLRNRLGLNRLLEAGAMPTGDPPSGLILIDLDDFKEVNDTLGHPIGDEMLIAVAKRITEQVRPQDTVTRLGGDEFSVLLSTDPRGASLERVAQRLVDAFDTPFETTAGPLPAGASVGLAVAEPNMDPALLLRDADLALYAAKTEGKHRWQRYHSGLLDTALRRANLRKALDETLHEGRLAVWYQPVIYLDSGQISGFEALVRWPHPTLGLLSPDEFVPLAEQTGQIIELGNQVLRTAIGQAASWNAAAPDRPTFIGINVSAHQLRDPEFVDAVRETVGGSGLDPRLVALEVTETALLDHDDLALQERLRELRALGVGIALDNFGTGFASLISLHDLPIDFIKIDKSFIAQLLTSERMANLIRGVLGIAESLGIRTLAEGVESRAQHAALRALNCGAAQGFLYASPLPAAEATAILSAGRPLITQDPDDVSQRRAR